MRHRQSGNANLPSFYDYKYSFEPLHCTMLCFSAEKDASVIRIYDGRGTKEPLKVLDNLHESPVSIIRVNTLQSVFLTYKMYRIYQYLHP